MVHSTQSKNIKLRQNGKCF